MIPAPPPAADLPGLTAVVERPPAPPDPLRSDIAVLAGRTVRGPVGEPTPVVGWREYQARYGGLTEAAQTPYAVRSYFDNGGQLAWIVRIEGSGPEPGTASGRWTVGEVTADGQWAEGAPATAGFPTDAYEVVATSPGAWATGTEVAIELRLDGSDGAPEVDVRVDVPGEAPEHFDGLAPAVVSEVVTARSRHVAFTPTGIPIASDPSAPPGPRSVSWVVELDGGSDHAPTVGDYVEAAQAIADLDEPALVCLPDLAGDLAGTGDRTDVLGRVIGDAAASLDRLVLVDVPPEHLEPAEAVAWVGELRATLGDPQLWRAAAVHHPPVLVDNPPGGLARPLRTVPPSGAVAGVVSRLDRERGAHHTPANALVYQAADLAGVFDERGQAQLHRAGIDNLRCSSRGGIEVWGGRTLDTDPLGRFVAHRRLLHRLVRAARRVAEPLVFDTNGPELWLTVVRALTTVLLESFRSGGLKGLTPDQAFRIQCDEELNPPGERDSGRVVCLVSLAPATPMEFIVLRLSFGLQGALEVVEQ